MEVGGTRQEILPWRNDVANPHPWWFRCKLVIDNFLLHAWSEEGFRQLLGDLCLFHRMEEQSFTQEETRFFEVWAWMWNSDLLPRSKLVFFFAEGAGRVLRHPDQPQPPSIAPPPHTHTVSDLKEVLIHPPYYKDWKSAASPLPDSGVSGLPSSASSSPPPFPAYHEFVWHEGVLDGRTSV